MRLEREKIEAERERIRLERERREQERLAREREEQRRIDQLRWVKWISLLSSQFC